MADSQTVSIKERPRWIQSLKRLVVPVLILLMAGGILFLIAGNWNTWASERRLAGNRRRLRASGPHAVEHQGRGTGGDGSGLRLSAGESRRSARPVAG